MQKSSNNFLYLPHILAIGLIMNIIINIITSYLKFQESNPDYELPYIPNKQIEDLKNITKKYPELHELILKVLSARSNIVDAKPNDK